MNKRFIRILSSAGGGKTYKLSTRYINLLKKDSDNLKRTLAITFTNKAASEMKQRILSLLKDEALNKGSNSSEKLVDHILNNYSDFSVRTIDSFINTLVKGFSIELGLPPKTELILDSEYYKDYALSRLIGEIENDKILRDKIIDFLINKIDLDDKTNWDLAGILKKGFDRIENYEKYYNIIFKEPEKQDEDIDQKLKDFRKKISITIKELLEYAEMNEGINRRFLNFLKNNTNNIDNLLTSTKWKQDCDKLLTKKATFDKGFFCSLFEGLKNILFEYYTHKIFRDHNHHIKIYKDYKEKIKEVKEEKRIRFIEDINSELGTLFGEFDVPFIFYRYGERYYHYLIDEFQDTSQSQWKNLKPLIENSLSEGGSFFFVGDPKQAIYQWRGGKVELFNDAFESFWCIEEEDKEKEFVPYNYRSAPEIVKFVGEVFSNLPADIEEKIGEKGRVYKENAAQEIAMEKHWDGFEGYISLKKITSKTKHKDDVEKSIGSELLITIKDILKRFSFGDITILVRTNKEGKTVVDWLTEEGYRVISNESLYLSSNANVKGLISLLKFLQHPVDDIAFFGFITSPFFEKKSECSFDSIKDWAENVEKKGYLYVLFRRDFPEIWEMFIQPFFSSVGFLPLYDLLNEVIRVFSIPENFPESEPFLEGLLEFTHNLEKKSITSIELMIEEWERAEDSKHPPSILLPENTDAIRIMTIHSAKGLEFPVVIIPFLYFSGKKNINEIVVEYNGTKRIAKITKKNKEYILPEHNPTLKKEIYTRIMSNEIDSLFEEINNLYVGMTRPKYELHIFIPEQIPATYRREWKEILSKYIGDGDYTRGTTLPPPQEMVTEEQLPVSHLHLTTEDKNSVVGSGTRLLLKKSAVDSYLNKNRHKALKLGDLVHRVLYYIEDLSDIENLESIIERSLNELALPGEREFFKGTIKEIVKRTLDKEEIRKWFAQGLVVWREKEMVDKDGKINRFDRVVFREKEIELIDYKTGQEPISHYKKQIMTYKKTLEDYFPKKKVTAYIIQLEKGEVIKIE